MWGAPVLCSQVEKNDFRSESSPQSSTLQNELGYMHPAMALRHVLTTLNRTKRKHECVTTTIRVWGHWNSHLKRGLQKWNAPGSTKFVARQMAAARMTNDSANHANDCGTRPKFTQVRMSMEWCGLVNNYSKNFFKITNSTLKKCRT